MELIFGIIFVLIIILHFKFRPIESFFTKTLSLMDTIIEKKLTLMPSFARFFRDYNIQDPELVQNLTKLCSIKYDKCNKSKKIEVANLLEQVTSQINSITEKYPELNQDTRYVNLVKDLQNVDGDIANSSNYNNTVSNLFNSILNVIPIDIRNCIGDEQKTCTSSLKQQEKENNNNEDSQ